MPSRFPTRRVERGLLGETLVEAGRLRFLDERIRPYDLRIGRVFAHDERCQRLAKVEGIGDAFSARGSRRAGGGASEELTRMVTKPLWLPKTLNVAKSLEFWEGRS